MKKLIAIGALFFVMGVAQVNVVLSAAALNNDFEVDGGKPVTPVAKGMPSPFTPFLPPVLIKK